MLYMIKHFVSHRLDQTADMSNTGLLINLLLLPPVRIKNKKKTYRWISASAPENDLNQVALLRPFELPLSPLPSPRLSGTPRRHEACQPRSGIPRQAPGTRLAALFRHLSCAHLVWVPPSAGLLLTRVPRGSPSRPAGQASRPLQPPPAPVTCAECPPCPPGTRRVPAGAAAAAAPAPHGCGSGSGRKTRSGARSPAQPPGPAAAGGNTRTGSTGGVGGGTGGARASKRPPRYKMLLTFRSRRC